MKFFGFVKKEYMDWDLYCEKMVLRESVLFVHNTAVQSLKNLSLRERKKSAFGVRRY